MTTSKGRSDGWHRCRISYPVPAQQHSPSVCGVDLGVVEALRTSVRISPQRHNSERLYHGRSRRAIVLALTTFNDDELLSAVLPAGAAGFVLKDSPAEELIRAVRAVGSGKSYLDPDVTARVLSAYRGAAPPASRSASSRHGKSICSP